MKMIICCDRVFLLFIDIHKSFLVLVVRKILIFGVFGVLDSKLSKQDRCVSEVKLVSVHCEHVKSISSKGKLLNKANSN